ncbi:hypothetical protein V3C99_012736 [Haemonchus contortus]
MVEKTKSKQQQPTKRDNSKKSSQVGTTPRLTEERETLRQTRKKKKLSKLVTAEEPDKSPGGLSLEPLERAKEKTKRLGVCRDSPNNTCKDSKAKRRSVAKDTSAQHVVKEKTRRPRSSSEPIENPGKSGSKGGGQRRGTFTPEVERAVADFVKYTTETAGIEGLRKECKIVLDYKPNPGTYTTFENHPEHNRYPEIPCLDETRVIIQQEDDAECDYIHANRVKMDKADREFIMTQAPKTNTIEDFWRMVFQQQCSGLVLLCNYREESTQSCEEFFPTDAAAYKYFGQMFVNTKKVDHLEKTKIYTIEVLPDGCSNSFVTQLAHFTSWPEKAIPSNVRMVLKLIRWSHYLEPGPIGVICNAGVGRSGAYVAIDVACARLFKGYQSSMKDIALELRRQRACSIDNDVQYFFVYSTVLCYIKAKMPKYSKQVSKFYADLKQSNYCGSEHPNMTKSESIEQQSA